VVVRTDGSLRSTSPTVRACCSWINCDVYDVVLKGVSIVLRLPRMPSLDPAATWPPGAGGGRASGSAWPCTVMGDSTAGVDWALAMMGKDIAAHSHSEGGARRTSTAFVFIFWRSKGVAIRWQGRERCAPLAGIARGRAPPARPAGPRRW